MAKAKKSIPAAVLQKAQAKKPNPFELKRNKTKFEVVGRKVKGALKNVVQARQDAHNKRKSTLLVEYKQLRKANTFKDRRLGEAGSDMTEDDRALAKLQALRMKQAKRKGSSKFSLSEADENGGGLTHMGKSLSDMGDLNEAPPSLDELDDDMVADLVATYNFGGGDAERDENGVAKTRKQVMEEIIAKSKMYKALKAKQKEEDENELDKLNDEFRELIQRHSLAALIKPAGYMKGVKLPVDNELDAAYDVATRSLAAEARGAAGERTLTPEELEFKEKERLEKLERARVQRMRAGANCDADGTEGLEPMMDQPMGGYAARRKRIRETDGSEEGSDDDGEGEDDEDEEDGDGDDDDLLSAALSALEARRRQQAAGDHPLQDSFREQAAALLAKYGMDAKNPLVDGSTDDDGSDEGEDDEDGGELDEDEDDDDGGEGDDEGEEGEAVASEDGVMGEGEESVEDDEDEDAEDEGEDNDDDAYPPAAKKQKTDAQQPAAGAGDMPTAKVIRLPADPKSIALQQQQQQKQKQAEQQKQDKQAQHAPLQQAAGALPEEDEPLDLPYTIPIPQSYDAFARLVNGRPAQHLALAIHRIRAFNAQKLAADSKKQLQLFYGILVQHFAMLAGQSPLPFQSLDVLMQSILVMTGEVPFYSATVARARLQKMHERLSAALKSNLTPADSNSNNSSASTWPATRTYLQLRLFCTLFPLSDRRHPVITPLTLLVNKHLSQCTATSLSDVNMALLLCSMSLSLAEAGGRFTPEPLNFLVDALRSVSSDVSTSPPSQQPSQPSTASPQQQQQGQKSRKKGGKQATQSAKSSDEKTQAGSNTASQTIQQENAATTKASKQLVGVGGGAPKVLPNILHFSSTSTATIKSVQSTQPSLEDALERRTQPASQTTVGAAQHGSNQQVADVLSLVLSCAGRAAKMVIASAGPATPAALTPLIQALRALPNQAALPDQVNAARQNLLKELVSKVKEVEAGRKPLVQAARIRAPVIKEYTPRFEEEGFVLGRDYDPDRVRAEQKKLKRQLAKEKRGAMRELRRDAVFMAQVRDRERSAVDAERMDNQKKFYAELQAQEADMKSGGQKGMNPHLAKKKK